MQTQRRTGVLTAILLLAAPACAGDAETDRGRTPAHAAAAAEREAVPGCSLLTAAEIESATGAAPARAEWDDDNVRGCSWYDADGRPLLGLVIGAAPSTYEAYLSNLRDQTEEMGSPIEGFDTATVAGVGDYALWHDSPNNSYLNAALDGDLFVLMFFRDPVGSARRRDAAVQLARSGLERM